MRIVRDTWVVVMRPHFSELSIRPQADQEDRPCGAEQHQYDQHCVTPNLSSWQVTLLV